MLLPTTYYVFLLLLCFCLSVVVFWGDPLDLQMSVGILTDVIEHLYYKLYGNMIMRVFDQFQTEY